VGQVTARQAAIRAAVFGLLAWLIITVIGIRIGDAVDGSAGFWGSALGAIVAGLFFSVTAVIAVTTTKIGPDKLGFVILGSWLLKIVILMGVLAWLRTEDFYSRPFFFAVLVIQTMVLLTLEAVILTRAKVPYVDPQ
jgi:hypothetical protein